MKNKIVSHLIKIILVIIVLYFVWSQLSKNISEIKDFEWSLHPGWLVMSIIGHLITLLCFSKVWCFLISGFGHHVSLKHAFKISYITNLGRYIPGKIWPVFGMAYYARKINIPEQTAVASWTIAMLFALPSAFSVVFLGMLIEPDFLMGMISTTAGVAVYFFAIITFFISIILIVRPFMAFKFYNMILKLLKRTPVNFQLKPSLAFKVYIGYAMCWTLYGLSFWMLLKAIEPDQEIPIVQSIITFVLAYQIGYLAFFAPGGIGVRELTITKGLSPFFGAVAVGISIIARIWNLIVEITAFLIALSIKLPNTNRDSKNDNQ